MGCGSRHDDQQHPAFLATALLLLTLVPAAKSAEYPAQKIGKTAAVRFGEMLTEVEGRLGAMAEPDKSPIARPEQDFVLLAGPVTLKFDNRKLAEIAVRSDFDFRLGLAPWPEAWRNFDAIGTQRIAAGMKKPDFMKYLAAWEERATKAGARKVERSGPLKAGEFVVSIASDEIIDMVQIAFGPERSSDIGGAWGDSVTINFVPGQSDYLQRKPGTLTGVFFSCEEFHTLGRRPAPVAVKRDSEVSGTFSKVDVLPKPRAQRNPIHPPAFRRFGIRGEAVLAFVIETDGTTSQVQYVSATDIAFAEAAIAAVKHWRFEPATRNGEPVAASVQMAFVFEPEKASR